MSAGRSSESGGGFGALRQFARRERPLERCELCSLGLRADHPHLLEIAQRRLVCACDACTLLFTGPASKYKRVPRRYSALTGFQLNEAEWNALMIPINMAFFFTNSRENRVVAMYPSPAGATESMLPLESWNDILARNPTLLEMEPDVEALLVNRLGFARGYSGPEYYLLPIDECYKLVGLIRMHWKGLSGGTEVWQKLGEFFANLKERSTQIGDTPRAQPESHA